MNTRGISLIEVLVGGALVGIVALVSATIISSQGSSMKFLAQKSAAVEIKEQLLSVMQTAATCSCQLNPGLTTDDTNDSNLTWNKNVTDGSAIMNIKKIATGCAVGAPVVIQEGDQIATDLTVAKVDFMDLRPTGLADEWMGKFRITFVARDGQVSIAPIELEQTVAGFDYTSAAGLVTFAVQACKTATASAAGLVSTCPAGANMVGAPNAIGTYCIQAGISPATTFLNAKLQCGTVSTYGVGHICDHSEYYTACVDGLLNNSNPPTNEIWLGDFDSEYAMTADLNVNGCNGIGNELLGGSLGYRCCWR